MVAVNIVIEVIGGVIPLVLIVSLYVHGDMKTRAGRLFGWILGLQTLVFGSDAVSWALEGRAEVWALAVARVTNFTAYSAGIAVHVFFVEYLLACIGGTRQASRVPVYVTIALCCLLEGTIILSEFTGMVYSIDAQGIFHIGPMHGVFTLLLSAVYLHIAAVTIYYWRSLRRSDALVFLLFVGLMLSAFFMEMLFSYIMINYAVSTLATLTVYVNIQAKKSQQHEREMAESRIAMMLSQIQPHFLYNTLVAIERLCVKDPEEARATVASFSTYLRGNLDSLSIRKPIPFAKELEHVKNYLSLEQKRFGDRLHIVYDIEAHDFLLPALTLQMVVENAVRHGVMQRVAGGTVTIRTRAHDTHWCITVQDDGVGFRPDALAQDGQQYVGLENVRGRLRTICGGHLDIQSEPGRGTAVRLYIPKEETVP